MKVLITGAGGYFAWEFIRQAKATGVEVRAVTSNPKALKQDANYSGVDIISNSDLLSNDDVWQGIDYLIHSAFCRKDIGDDLVKSLYFSNNIISKVADQCIKGIVNLSSQSVYGSKAGVLPCEKRAMNPSYLYAMAKASTEIMLSSIMTLKNNPHLFTSFRLSSLLGISKQLPNNLVYKFLCSGLAGEPFKVIGGQQRFSFLDVRDAAKGLLLFLKQPPDKWDTVYNVGPLRQIGILEIADIVCDEVQALTGRRGTYSFLPDDTQLNSGMDSGKFYGFLGWEPEFSFRDTVRDTAAAILREKG